MPPDRNKTVIVLDDDPSVCRALRIQLETLGFEVLVFHSADRLLSAALPLESACLLADVYLPGMNGAELCVLLNRGTRRLPTILMSGRDDQQTLRLMRQAGPIARLFKPFDEATLLKAIMKALGKPFDPDG